MVVLGLLLVAAAAVFGTEMVLSNTETSSAEAFNETVSGISAGEFFLIGAGTALALCLGLWLMSAGFGRSRRRRAAARTAVNEKTTALRETEGELSGIAEENERLRAELAEERRNRLTMGGAAMPPETGDGTAYDTRTYDVTDGSRRNGSADPYPGDTDADRTTDLRDETVDETTHKDGLRR